MLDLDRLRYISYRKYILRYLSDLVCLQKLLLQDNSMHKAYILHRNRWSEDEHWSLEILCTDDFLAGRVQQADHHLIFQ